MFADLLLPMFDDEYYPDILVAEIKQHIERLLQKYLNPVYQIRMYISWPMRLWQTSMP